MNKYYILALVFALASSMRIPLLPEIQYALVLLLLYKGSTRKVFFVIIIIFCTHHYAVPDAFFRFNADDYPSIYTKTIGLVKILDILIITIFLFSLSKIHSLKKIFNKSLPLFVIPFAFLGLFTINSETFHEIIFLFSLRSLLLLISIFLLANSLTSRDLIFSAKLAMFSWALKMLFAILIPQEFPLYREIFGFQGIVFFAGDEYLTIGIYLSLLLLLSTKDSLSFLKIFTFINFVFLLTLIAQRKGGIPYFVILNVILIFYF